MGAILLFLSVVIVFVTAAFYAIRRHYMYWEVRGIPYEKPHIIYGNIEGFRTTTILQDIYCRLYKKFKGTGPFCGLYSRLSCSALILDVQLVKNILIKDFSNFANRGFYNNERDDPLSAHLFALDGPRWRQLRHKLSSTFTSGKMKFMFPTVVEVGEKFIEVFDKLVQPEGSTVEIKELLARFTTDVIGTCAFGIECNSLNDPDAEFRVLGRRSVTARRHGFFITSFMFSFPSLARKLRLRMTPEDIHQFFLRIVRDTVTLREQQDIKRNDFMDLLIQLKQQGFTKSENPNDDDEDLLQGLTVEQMAAQAFVFFIAGFETSSTTMGFALYELARQQEIQDKLRKEIKEVLARHSQQFTYECLKEMSYLKQVVSETLRLHTIVPHLVRQPLNDYVVPGHPKYVLEKGINVFIPASAIHLDPEFYPEPHEFKPERFTPELIAERESVLWLPFGDGPRNCIGMRFGQMQTYIGLIMLLNRFKFSVGPQTQVPLVYEPKSFLLQAKGGINLQVERI